MSRTYVIRRTFLFPLGILLLLCLGLLALCLVQNQPLVKSFLLGFIILPIIILFVESAFRKAIIDSEGVTVYKLCRSKRFLFSEMTSVDTVQVRKRVFLTLSAGDDFLIISNAYGQFPDLVAALLDRIASEAISEETRQMAQRPPHKSNDVVSCWLAVALMAFILYIQLGGTF